MQRDVYLEQPGAQFSFLSCFKEIKTVYETGKVYDLLITLDVSDKNRIGVAEEAYETAKKGCVLIIISATGDLGI